MSATFMLDPFSKKESEGKNLKKKKSKIVFMLIVQRKQSLF